MALHALMLAREAEFYIAGSQTSPGSAFAKADDVLPGTGSNFESDALFRQNPNKHLSDWPTIARGRRGELSRVADAAANLDRQSAGDDQLSTYRMPRRICCPSKAHGDR